MKQRTLGLLGAALLVGGVVLGIAGEIASSRIAPANGTTINRPANGAFPRHRNPGQPGPFFGDPRHRGSFPGNGRPGPINASPKPPANPSPSG